MSPREQLEQVMRDYWQAFVDDTVKKAYEATHEIVANELRNP